MGRACRCCSQRSSSFQPVAPQVSKAAAAPLQVTPGALDFGQLYVGATASLTLTLRNEGKVARAARLELEAPFTSQPTALTVGGGDAIEVVLTVTPTAPGTSSATVRVDETDVELSVTAVAVPSCEVPGPCERAHFDLARGECGRETSVAAGGSPARRLYRRCAGCTVTRVPGSRLTSE